MEKYLSYQRLVAVLERAQTEGALGTRPIPEVISHARAFVAALPPEVENVVDLGSGAGIPGLVIALDRPEIRITLVDRRAKRVDALRRAVTALEWMARVNVLEADAHQLALDPARARLYDAAVARGFGPPRETLHVAASLVHPGGWVIISEPPDDVPSRWDPQWLTDSGAGAPERYGSVVRFHVEHPTGSPDSPVAVT